MRRYNCFYGGTYGYRKASDKKSLPLRQRASLRHPAYRHCAGGSFSLIGFDGTLFRYPFGRRRKHLRRCRRKGRSRFKGQAAEAGDLRAVERIIKLGDDVNGNDIVKECPLKYASAGGHVDVMKYLVEHGADVDKANEYGMTPLMGAVCRFNAKSVRCLIELGADEKLLNNEGRSAETMAREEIVVVLENAVKRRESQKVMALKRDKGIDR